MRTSNYYREQAARARRWADEVRQRELGDLLSRVAVDYDHVAEDLERGLVEVRHPELMPQNQKSSGAARDGA
jgi:hypothetical protein